MGFVYILDPDLYGAAGVGLEWQKEGPGNRIGSDSVRIAHILLRLMLPFSHTATHEMESKFSLSTGKRDNSWYI